MEMNSSSSVGDGGMLSALYVASQPYPHTQYMIRRIWPASELVAGVY
jgi:hypothetical protein